MYLSTRFSLRISYFAILWFTKDIDTVSRKRYLIREIRIFMYMILCRSLRTVYIIFIRKLDW